MVNDNSVYAICQNKIFLAFNEWLEASGLDFRYLPEDDMNSYIAIYTHFIEYQLRNLMEQYNNAD